MDKDVIINLDDVEMHFNMVEPQNKNAGSPSYDNLSDDFNDVKTGFIAGLYKKIINFGIGLNELIVNIVSALFVILFTVLFFTVPPLYSSNGYVPILNNGVGNQIDSGLNVENHWLGQPLQINVLMNVNPNEMNLGYQLSVNGKHINNDDIYARVNQSDDVYAWNLTVINLDNNEDYNIRLVILDGVWAVKVLDMNVPKASETAGDHLRVTTQSTIKAMHNGISVKLGSVDADIANDISLDEWEEWLSADPDNMYTWPNDVKWQLWRYQTEYDTYDLSDWASTYISEGNDIR